MNYPDDIRCYDDDPRSPFYVDPDAWVEDVAAALSEDWYSEYLRDGRIDYLDWNVDDITILLFQRKAKTVREVITDEAYKVVQANPHEFMPEQNYEALNWD